MMEIGRRWPALVGGVAVVATVVCARCVLREQARTQALVERLTRTVADSDRRVTQPTWTLPVLNPTGPSSDELRTLLREELVKVRPEPLAEVPSKAPDEALDPQQNAPASEQAQSVLRRAQIAHVWGEAEAAEFRRLVPELNEEQLRSMLRQLVPAINRQEIRVAVVGAVLF
jgi:hypothetical protein